MTNEQKAEVAGMFFEGVELIQNAMQAMDGRKYKVKFDIGNCGMWTLRLIPEAETQAQNT